MKYTPGAVADQQQALVSRGQPRGVEHTDRRRHPGARLADDEGEEALRLLVRALKTRQRPQHTVVNDRKTTPHAGGWLRKHAHGAVREREQTGTNDGTAQAPSKFNDTTSTHEGSTPQCDAGGDV